MRNLKFGVLTLGLALTMNLSAQQDTKHKGGHDKIERISEELNLTEKQKTDLKALHTDMKQKREAIKNNASLTEEQQKEQMKALHKDKKEAMKGILSAEQIAKMKEMKAKHKDHKKDRAEFAKELNLSDAQKESMQAIKKYAKNKREAVKNNTSLSEEQKKSEMKTINQDAKKKAAEILTPEQKELMKEHRKDKKGKK